MTKSEYELIQRWNIKSNWGICMGRIYPETNCVFETTIGIIFLLETK